MMLKKICITLSILLFTALGAGQSNQINQVPENVWITGDDSFEFQVDYTDQCQKSISVEFNDASTEIDLEETNVQNNTYQYTLEPSDSGQYKIIAMCENNSKTASKTFQAGRLQLNIENSNIPENNGVFYPGEKITGKFALTTDNNQMENEISNLRENIEFKSTLSSDVGINENNFEIDVTQSDVNNINELKLRIQNYDSSDEIDDLSVNPVWKTNLQDVSANGDGVENSIDNEKIVKYRDLDSLRINLDVLKRGEPATGMSNFFMFDDRNRYFKVESDGKGSYQLSLNNAKPAYTEEELNVNTSKKIPIELETSSTSYSIGDKHILDLTIEKDVEFSGNVLDISKNRVKTEFKAFIPEKDKISSFSTDNSGNFQKYFETSAVDMEMSFPEAKVSLKSMDVGKKDAGDISYQYYKNPVQESNIEINKNVRPINLAAFVSNYPFQGDSLETFIDMQYDTNNVDPLKVEVYECNQWTFDAEECSTEWKKIDSNDVTLSSGSTWKANFPINPLTSKRFVNNEGVLQNAYLIGVPQGVGSSLTLRNSLDVSSTRLKSGKELSISGQIIDTSTGKPVENAKVSLVLKSNTNTVKPENVTTNRNGNFKFSEEIEKAGGYTVDFKAQKKPYESFSKKSNTEINVYYETGISVSSEDNVDIQLGDTSTIEFELKNVGQSPIKNTELSLDVSGIDDEYYSWTEPSWTEIGVGDSRTLNLNLNIPDSGEVSPGRKSIRLTASGKSADDDIENSATVYASVPAQQQEESGSTQKGQEKSAKTQSSDSGSSFDMPGTGSVTKMTGNFVSSQSQMNVALGLMLIFGAVMAVAVRKRKDNGGGRENRMAGRVGPAGSSSKSFSTSHNSSIQRPNVSPNKQNSSESAHTTKTSEVESDNSEHEDSKDERSEVENNSEKEESNDSDLDLKCDVCGDELDTKSGLKIHKQALH